MNKSLKIVLIIIVILILIFLLNIFGLLSFLNNPLNKVISGKPDISCKSDFDCSMKYIECGSCSECGVINYDKWKPFCPFKSYEKVCGPIVSCILDDHLIKCVDNKCKKIPV